jgi:iron complex transport system substrate-binding protein
MKLRALLLFALAALLTACAGGPALVATDTQPTVAPAATAVPAPASAPDATSAPAATSVPAASSTISVVDGSGQQLSFDTPPTRVVCYYNSCYGMLATLGVKPVAQAVNPEMLSDPIYFEGQGTSIPTLRRDGDAVDLEDVAAAKPDLVIVYSAEEAQALDGIAPAFREFETNNLDDVFAALRAYGTLLGREDQAEAAIECFEARLAAYSERAPRDVSVLKLGVNSPESFSIGTRNDPICQILNQLARCDWPDPTGASDTWSYDASIESVLALDPDVIILNNWTQWGDTALDDAQLRAALAQNPLWQELRAVKNGRVLSTPGYDNPIASSLPAAAKFLDVYMPLLYPEVFPQPLSEADVRQSTGATAAENGPVTVVDGTGATLTLTQRPQRVVCLINKCIEDLAFLGVAPVGVGAIYNYNIARDERNFGVAAEQFVQIPSEPTTDWEAVAALRPDLIIAWHEDRAAAEGIAPFYALKVEENSIDEFAYDLRNYARIFGMEEQAEAKIERTLDRLAAYAARSPKDKTLFITGTDGATFYSYDPAAFWPCGIINQFTPCAYPAGPGGELSVEGLLAVDPDVIVVEEYEPEKGTDAAKVAELERTNPLWKELTAYKTGAIFVLPRTEARITALQSMTNVLDTLMPLMYPEVFPDPLTEAEVQEATSR